MTQGLLAGKTPVEILALYRRYRDGEKVAQLMVELGITDIADSVFAKRAFKRVRINDLSCPLCGVYMLAELPSKNQPLAREKHECVACNHVVYADLDGTNARPSAGCDCIKCVTERKKAQEKSAMSFADKIRNAYKNQSSLSITNIDEVNLAELVGLHALVHTWAAEDMSHLVPLEKKLETFWPTQDKSTTALGELYRSSMLQIDLNHGTTDMFVEKEGGKINWYIRKTVLIPSISQPGLKCMGVPETLGYLGDIIPNKLTNKQKSELTALIRAIAVDECVQYMQYMLEEHGFDTVVGEKTQKIFEELLESLPVSQIYACIWTAVKGAAAFLQTPSCSGRNHAYNTIQGKMRDAAMKRISGEIEANGFDRYKLCSRSEVSHSLYRLLGFDADVGFTTRLADIQIPDAWLQETEEDEYIEFTPEDEAALTSRGFTVHHMVASRVLAFTNRRLLVSRGRQEEGLCYNFAVVNEETEQVYRSIVGSLYELVFFIAVFEQHNELSAGYQ